MKIYVIQSFLCVSLIPFLPLPRKYAFQLPLTKKKKMFSVTDNVLLSSHLAESQNPACPDSLALYMRSQLQTLSYPVVASQLNTEKARCLQAILPLTYYLYFAFN